MENGENILQRWVTVHAPIGGGWDLIQCSQFWLNNPDIYPVILTLYVPYITASMTLHIETAPTIIGPWTASLNIVYPTPAITRKTFTTNIDGDTCKSERFFRWHLQSSGGSDQKICFWIGKQIVKQ